MQKKYLKVVFTLLMILICICFFSNTAFAELDFDRFEGHSTNAVDNVAKSAMATGVEAIRIIATGVSLIMLSYLGIRYMMAAPNEKADFKKSSAIFVFGAIITFAASSLLGIIANFATNL